MIIILLSAHLLDEVVKEVEDYTGYGVLTGVSYRL